VQDMSEKLGVRAWIYARPGGSVLESSASFQWIENETSAMPLFWQGFSLASF